MSVFEVGDKVIHRTFHANPTSIADWGVGIVESVLEDVTVEVVWAGDTFSMPHQPDELEPFVSVDIESPLVDEEEEMERKYELNQLVLDAGGMDGHIVGYEERDKGIFYKVQWVDGRETTNIQSALYAVPEDPVKVPTPLDVHPLPVVVSASSDAMSVIEAWDLNFSLGNVVQSVYNASQDGSLELQELERAAYFLSRRIESLKGRAA